jgi:hypothetical protein
MTDILRIKLIMQRCDWTKRVFCNVPISDEPVKTLNLLATVIRALDNNTQGQAAAGIQ